MLRSFGRVFESRPGHQKHLGWLLRPPTCFSCKSIRTGSPCRKDCTRVPCRVFHTCSCRRPRAFVPCRQESMQLVRLLLSPTLPLPIQTRMKLMQKKRLRSILHRITFLRQPQSVWANFHALCVCYVGWSAFAPCSTLRFPRPKPSQRRQGQY